MNDHLPMQENSRLGSADAATKESVSQHITASNLRMFDKLDPTFDYTWKWFEMHVAHRQTMFRYFLIIAGILAAVYIQAMPHPERLFSAGVAFAGFF